MMPRKKSVKSQVVKLGSRIVRSLVRGDESALGLPQGLDAEALSLPLKPVQATPGAALGPGVVFRPRDPVPAQRTLVVMGSYRGGTSMVAGILRLLGVFMGYNLGRTNNEDLDFQEERDFSPLGPHIQRRNAEFGVWGWKFPGSLGYIETVLPQLRNPHFLIICRDPVAIAQREHLLGNYTFGEALRLATLHQFKLLTFTYRTPHPVFLISYERSLRGKSGFVRDLAAFAHLPVTEERSETISSFIVSGGSGTVSSFARDRQLQDVIAFEKSHGVREISGGRAGLAKAK
jgi:hypothetical protein